MKASHIKRIAVFGMLTALAFVLSYVEYLLPPFFPSIPGIKLGLANIVVLVCLYTLGPKEALFITLIRVLLTAFTFGNINMMLFSMSGAILSYLIMFLLKVSKKFSIIGVSTAGGIAHNIGQILVATITLGGVLIYYLPALLLSGVISGIAIGSVGAIVVRCLPKNRF